MQEDESLEPILLTLEGKNGKIELKETTVRIVFYVRNDPARIGKVHEIPREKITKAEYVKILGLEHAIRVYFPGAGLMGNVAVYINDEQVSNAEKMIKMLTKTESSIVTNDEALKLNLNTDTQDNKKLPEKRGIKEKLPLINSETKGVRIVGYLIYAFVFLMILGALSPSSDKKTADEWYIEGNALYDQSYGLFDQGKNDDAIKTLNEVIKAYDNVIGLDPKNSSAWTKRGSAFLDLGDASKSNPYMYRAALEAYDEAIRLEPENADAWAGKAMALFSLGRTSEAYDTSAKAKELGY